MAKYDEVLPKKLGEHELVIMLSIALTAFKFTGNRLALYHQQDCHVDHIS